eukprot:TRINITY_DN66724_c4_g4_i2.p1 TRINITY_DN66724_c4_g4~~TRINITY_DN66724_c4_g4_i2.p1  ORF type:complete len:282 (+),score=132.35 TRINITY_DN66724_c4_g4_i2:100-945(+)
MAEEQEMDLMDVRIENAGLEAEDGGDGLEFHQGGLGSGSESPDASSFTSADQKLQEEQSLLREAQYDGAQQDDSNASIFSMRYYRRFFNVTTNKVVHRLTRSVLPSTKEFLTEEERADLYGPLWICSTLVFLTAAAGNFASYLEFDDADGKQTWKYDFEKVTLAASLFYSTISILPVAVYIWLRRLGQPRALTDLICIYGYSLTIFVPVCILCVVPSSLLRWLCVMVGFAVSSNFLTRNVWNQLNVTRDGQQQAYILLAAILIAHLSIALTMRWYFFDFSS